MHRAVVLAAGKGTRLGPLTRYTPKPMLPVQGRPLIDHTLEKLAKAGVMQVFINLHHCPDLLTEFCGSGSRWGVNITYSHEPELLGSAGTVRSLARALGSEPFLVLYGDNYFECDLPALERFHQARSACVTMALIEKQDVAGSGIVEVDTHGRVLRFKEKPAPHEVFSRLVNGGAYVIEPEVVSMIPDTVPCDFSHDIFPQLLAQDRAVYGLVAGHVWGIDTPELYEALLEHSQNDAF